MSFSFEAFDENYEWFPLADGKPIEDLTEGELAAFTQSFVDLEDDRIQAIRTALQGQLPFDSDIERVEAIARLIAASRLLDGDGEVSATTYSLCFDYGCVLRPLLRSYNDGIEWRFHLRNPKAITYGRPVLALENFYLLDYIDPIQKSFGTANFAYREGRDITYSLLDGLTRAASAMFGIELDFPYLAEKSE